MPQISAKPNSGSQPNHDGDMLNLGRLGKSHGVRGWMRLYYEPQHQHLLDPTTDHWQICKPPTSSDRPANWQPIILTDTRPQAQYWLIKLQGCDTPEQVSSEYTNCLLGVALEYIPANGDDQYAWHQLIGLEVKTTQAVPLGRVSHLFSTGANDVLVIEDANNAKQHYLPYIPQTVLKVDLIQNNMLVDWDPDF